MDREVWVGWEVWAVWEVSKKFFFFPSLKGGGEEKSMVI